MKKIASLCVTFASLFLVGCNNSSTDDMTATSKENESETRSAMKPIVDENTVSGEDVKSQIGEAINTTAEFTKQKRDEFAAELDKKLETLDAEIARLEAKTADLKDDAKVKWEEQMTTLREKRKAVSGQLEKVKASSAAGWQEIEAGMSSAWTDLKQSVDNAAAEFKKHSASETAAPDENAAAKPDAAVNEEK